MNGIKIISLILFTIYTSNVMGQTNQWDFIGPMGGIVHLVSLHPSYTDTIFVQSKDGHRFFRTTDGGENWTDITSMSSILSEILINPNQPEIILVATVNGIFKSVDLGQSWVQKTYLMANSITMVTSYPNILYSGAQNGIIHKSSDGGDNWTVITTGSSSNVGTIAVSPIDTNIIYITKWVYNPIISDSIFQSTDGCATWRDISPDFLNSKINTILINPIDTSIIYIGTQGTWDLPAQGLIKTNDGGNTWFLSNTGLPDQSSINALILDNNNPSILYAGLNTGLYVSIDGGNSWSIANNIFRDVSIYSIAFFPNIDENFFVGTNFGLFIGNTDESDFRIIGIYPINIESVIVDWSNPQNIYAAGRGLFKSSNGGEQWQLINNQVYYGKSIVMDPINNNILFAGNYSPYGAVYKSVDAGVNWEKVLEEVAINDVTIGLINTEEIYAGGLEDPFIGGLFKSSDAGASWDTLSNEFVIMTIVFEPDNQSIIYAGTHLQGIQKSIDSGHTWSPANDGLPVPINYFVKDIIINPDNTDIMYCGTIGHGIYKSVNAGLYWEAANEGLTNMSVRALLINPDNPDVIYAGTYGGGVFSSVNGGQSWEEMNQGLSSSNISSLYLEASSHTLYAGTFNSSIWRYMIESVSVIDDEIIPFTISLHQNHPNPFNPVTTIRYALPIQTEVKLTIYNIMGQEVTVLVSGILVAGEHEVIWNADNLSSGIYFYRLETPGKQITKKLVVLK